MASAPCHLLELPTAVLLLIADAASHRSVGRLAQASHLLLGPTLCRPGHEAHSIRCSHGTKECLASRHAFRWPVPFSGSRPRCSLRSLWHLYPCDSGRPAPCDALCRHAAPCPAGAHSRICGAPVLSSTSTHENNPASREVYGYDPCRCLAGGLDVHSCASCATHGPAIQLTGPTY